MKKKIPPTEADLRRLYVQAERFRFADELLRSKVNAKPDPQFAGAYVGLPSLVLSAFASELYLKCLTQLEGNEPLPTHNLKKLFKGLNGKTQKSLEKTWEADEAAQTMLNRLSQTIQEAVPTDLRSALDYGASAFDNLRYAHQKDLTQTNFVLGGLPRLLRKMICERKPEWANVGPKYGPLPTSRTL